MHHEATLTMPNLCSGRPYHAECKCGVMGDFPEKEPASGFIASHFAKLGGINTIGFVDKTNLETASAT